MNFIKKVFNKTFANSKLFVMVARDIISNHTYTASDLENILMQHKDKNILLIDMDGRYPLTNYLKKKCDILHLLKGNYLYNHTKLVRDKLEEFDLSVSEQNQLMPGILYGNLRYYYLLKSYLKENNIVEIYVPSNKHLLSPIHTITSAAKAINIKVLEYAESDLLE